MAWLGYAFTLAVVLAHDTSGYRGWLAMSVKIVAGGVLACASAQVLWACLELRRIRRLRAGL